MNASKIVSEGSNRFLKPRPLLACYLPFADPIFSKDMIATYRDNGVDIFELGLPCDRPYADGQEVASSMMRAFDADPGSNKLLKVVSHIRSDAPESAIVLMCYQSYLQKVAVDKEVIDLFDGVLCLPNEGESSLNDDILSLMAHREILFVPNEIPQPFLSKAEDATGYIMLQAHGGKTGMAATLSDNREQISQLKSVNPELPVLLGFGISKPEHARQAMQMGADGVVIGSACLAEYRQGGLEGLGSFLSSIRKALDE